MDKAWNHMNPESWEKRTAWGLFLVFTAVVIPSTILHHLFPHIMRVPAILPPRVIPGISFAAELIIGDITSLFIASIVLYHGYRKYGLGKIALFFFGSMIFSGLEENEWILLSGRILGNKSYYFTRGGLWFLEIPFYTCLGWFFITYSCFELFEIIGQKWRRISRALSAGLLAMSLDFFCDPILVNIGKVMDPPSPYGLWVWENENTLMLFSIPVMNFVGWALLVSLFCYLFGFISEQIDSGKYAPRKAVVIFFCAFPVMLLICYMSLSFLEALFQAHLGGVNLLPMDFPIR